MAILREFVKTPEGQQLLEANGFGGGDPYDLDHMRALAMELRRDIDEAFANETSSHHKLTENFSSAEVIKISYKTTGKYGVTLTLTYPDFVLGRLSIAKTYGDWDDPSSYFGRTYHQSHVGLYGGLDERFGVYDILGLFTQGYTLKGVQPKGSWVSAETYTVGSDFGITEVSSHAWARTYLSGSSFIADTIDAFIEKHVKEYPGLMVNFPAEWGGNI